MHTPSVELISGLPRCFLFFPRIPAGETTDTPRLFLSRPTPHSIPRRHRLFPAQIQSTFCFPREQRSPNEHAKEKNKLKTVNKKLITFEDSAFQTYER